MRVTSTFQEDSISGTYPLGHKSYGVATLNLANAVKIFYYHRGSGFGVPIRLRPEALAPWSLALENAVVRLVAKSARDTALLV